MFGTHFSDIDKKKYFTFPFKKILSVFIKINEYMNLD